MYNICLLKREGKIFYSKAISSQSSCDNWIWVKEKWQYNGGVGGEGNNRTQTEMMLLLLWFYYKNICCHVNTRARGRKWTNTCWCLVTPGVCTHVGVGFPVASQGRLMSSRENAVSDVGISVSTGGSDTENM